MTTSIQPGASGASLASLCANDVVYDLEWLECWKTRSARIIRDHLREPAVKRDWKAFCNEIAFYIIAASFVEESSPVPRKVLFTLWGKYTAELVEMPGADLEAIGHGLLKHCGVRYENKRRRW